jgi:hypothetical protein
MELRTTQETTGCAATREFLSMLWNCGESKNDVNNICLLKRYRCAISLPQLYSSSGCSGTALYLQHKYYTDTDINDHCTELIVFFQLPLVQLSVLMPLVVMLGRTQHKSQFLNIVVISLVLLHSNLLLCYHGNEINKPLHSNRHVPNITHVGGSHRTQRFITKFTRALHLSLS